MVRTTKGPSHKSLSLWGLVPKLKGTTSVSVKHKYGEILSREISYGKLKLLTFYNRSIASCTILNFQIHLRLNYLLKD